MAKTDVITAQNSTCAFQIDSLTFLTAAKLTWNMVSFSTNDLIATSIKHLTGVILTDTFVSSQQIQEKITASVKLVIR